MTTIYDLTYLRYPETMDEWSLRRILTISEFFKRELMELLDIPEEMVYTAAILPPERADSGECRRKWGRDGEIMKKAKALMQTDDVIFTGYVSAEKLTQICREVQEGSLCTRR